MESRVAGFSLKRIPRRRPVVFLDVDGVLAPLAPSSFSHLTPLPWAGFNGSIRYNAAIIEALRKMQDEWRFQWLTSWQEEANPCFAQVNFGPFPTHMQWDNEQWWKAEVVKHHLRRGQKTVWIDDEIHKHFRSDWGLVDWSLETYAQLLPIVPDAAQGLTLENIEQVKQFLSP